MSAAGARPPWLQRAWLGLQPLRQRGVHALLLYGPAGIGKKSLALEFAAALLCEVPRADGSACGTCAGCQLAAAGSHPDWRVVVPDALAALRPGADSGEADDEGAGEVEAEPDSKDKRASREIRIDQVRALADFMHVATHRAGARVVVLAPAEALNAPAANAALKMLEEPAAGTTLILVSDALDDVLPTIRSRCVLVRVDGPPWDEALHWLREQGVADAQAALAAAGGAPFRVVDQAGSAAGLDAATRQMLHALLAEGGALDAAAIAARVPRKIDVGSAIALFQRWAWDLLAHRSAGTVRYHRAQKAAIGRLSAGIDPTVVLDWMSVLNRMQASADHPLNPRLVVEAALLAYAAALRDGHAGARHPQGPVR
jgi:DNA polymerase-3 subunit delta'